MNKILFPPANEPMSQEELEYRAMRRELALIAERTELEAAKESGLAEALRRLIHNGMPEAQARAMLNM